MVKDFSIQFSLFYLDTSALLKFICIFKIVKIVCV